MRLRILLTLGWLMGAVACAPASSPVVIPVSSPAQSLLQATLEPAQTAIPVQLTVTRTIAPTNTPLSLPAPASFAIKERATIDRPDDSTAPQIHIMYVIPTDGVDEHLDTDGQIATSIRVIQNWFYNQSGGRTFRLDTYQGTLDVTFLRSQRTDAEIRASGAYVRDLIEREMIGAGFNLPNKLYAVFYGGSSDFACGGGAWPPTLPGIVGAIYLRGEPPGAIPCARNLLARTEFSPPGYWEISITHEMLHTMGFVAQCAPHQTRSGHVSDDPRDLMYAGPLPWQPSLLDVGRDDYFDHKNGNCLDLAKSAYLEQNAAPPLPPQTTTSILPAQDCAKESTLSSRSSTAAATIEFVNETTKSIQIFWLDYDKARRFFKSLSAKSSYTQSTFVDHSWVVADENNKCLGIYIGTGATNQVIIK